MYIGNKERNKNPIYSGGIHAGGSESALYTRYNLKLYTQNYIRINFFFLIHLPV